MLTWVEHTWGWRRGSCYPPVQLHSLSASRELNVNPFKALSVNREKAIKRFLLHWRLTLKGLYKHRSAMGKQKYKWLSKYCGWQWLSCGEWVQGWVQSAAVNKLLVLCFHALRCQKSIGVNYSFLFTLGLFIIPCVVGDMFHYKKQFTEHSPKKKKNRFIPMHVFLLSRINACPPPPPYPQTYSCITYLALERGYYSSRLFPQYFYFSAHYRKGS